MIIHTTVINYINMDPVMYNQISFFFSCSVESSWNRSSITGDFKVNLWDLCHVGETAKKGVITYVRYVQNTNKENYRLECQGAAKVSVLYIIQTDLYSFLFICFYNICHLFHLRMCFNKATIIFFFTIEYSTSIVTL